MAPIPSIVLLLTVAAAPSASHAFALSPASSRDVDVAVPPPAVAQIETISFGSRGAFPDQLYFDVEADGTIWVRGRTYKASFGAGGATYIPFLGSAAPRNYPVELSLVSARAGSTTIELLPALGAVREGLTIRIDRGAIDEVYELSLDSIEQTFVVETRPSGGELRLLVALESELARGETNNGVELSNELGGVRYGRAFVREDDGTRTPVASGLVDGGVEIEIGAEQMARATFPLVVDPIVSTFSINTDAASHFQVDVSYDVTTDRNASVYNDQFSATDFDIVSDLSSSTGALISRRYIDATDQNWWGPPRIANLSDADQFLVVGTADNVPWYTASSILGRTIQATDHSMSPKFVIAGSISDGNRRNCDVGGNSFPGSGAKYCVVWEHQATSMDSDVEARLVRRDTTLSGDVITLTSSSVADEEYPRISEATRVTDIQPTWNLVWHGNYAFSLGDILAARIRTDGVVETPRFVVSAGVADEAFASVSSPAKNGRYVVAWLSNATGGNYDVHAALIDGSTVYDTINVTALEAAGNQSAYQGDVEVETDGTRFLLVYSEGATATSFDKDVYATSLYSVPSDQLEILEAHQALGGSDSRERTPTLVSYHQSGSPNSRRFYIAWYEVDVADGPGDIWGAIYDAPRGGPVTGFCFGDGTNPTACPCGNVGITGHGCANSTQPHGGLLTHTGEAALSFDTLRLHAQGMPPSVTCTFFQGTVGLASASLFGDGVRCTYGTVIRLKTITTSPGGQASYPTGSDPEISSTGAIPYYLGAFRFYQVNYRNSATFCTNSTFNITNGMRAVWLP